MPEDYVIDQEHAFPLTATARWDANIAAIRLSKELDKSGRQATPAEQRVLGQYSGFGDSAFNQVFQGAYEPAWKKRKGDLEAVVTPEELKGIRFSRLNAFYTTPAVVKSMWSTIDKMGGDRMKKPKILEPSAGSGRFLGLQPPEMAERSERTAVELDPLTGSILKHAYPKTKVHVAGFEAAPTPDNHYDIAISNVPFGDIKVYDKEFNATGRKYLTNQIHNYFFAKALDKVRPGGVLAFITTAGTMNAPSAEPIRRYLADQADLMGAVRLPENAFPDTKVITDIMYLRKREEGAEPGSDRWVKSQNIPARTRHGQMIDVPVNQYFLDNPEKVLGKHTATGGMYQGESYNVEADPNRPVGETLATELSNIARTNSPIRAARPSQAQQAPQVKAMAGPPKYVLQDGQLRVKKGEKFTQALGRKAGRKRRKSRSRSHEPKLKTAGSVPSFKVVSR